jgi:integrase
MANLEHVRALSQAEVGAVLDALALHVAEGRTAPRYMDAVVVLLGTGLRIGELLALRATDWDGAAATLHVARSRGALTTKSGRARHVDVPARVAPILARRAQRGVELFPLCERTLRRVLVRACAEAGVRPCRLHDLRHTRITALLLAGVPALYVSQQAGHASVAFTMSRYGHLAVAPPEQRRAWANAA